MKNFAKNSRALISLNFILILTTFISLYLTATFAIALSQQRDYVRTTCVEEAAEIQSSLLKQVRELFSLNTASSGLRLSIRTTQAALAVAVTTMNLELVPVLENKLNGLYLAQKNLDAIQKALIAKAKAELAIKHLSLISKINRGQSDITGPWRFMLTMSSYFTARFTPALAVRPDPEGGIGPNYEWESGAEKKQTLAYSWNMFFATQESYQRFLNWVNVLSIQCAVSPNLKEEQWKLTINADK